MRRAHRSASGRTRAATVIQAGQADSLAALEEALPRRRDLREMGQKPARRSGELEMLSEWFHNAAHAELAS